MGVRQVHGIQKWTKGKGFLITDPKQSIYDAYPHPLGSRRYITEHYLCCEPDKVVVDPNGTLM